jgi:hypothetical protein
MSISRVALFAAAGLFVGGVAMPSAKAADLGGDCCADLEERVADLEATTARKGNRRMSLTVTGQVNRMVMWYDDGGKSDTYFGLDNTNSSSRFSFLGEAKVTSKVSVGFDITIEIEAGGTSSKSSQFDEDGRISSTGGWGIGNMASLNTVNQDAYFGDARRASWWIEHKDVGRLTVGRQEGAGAVTTIDLGGISVIASSSFGLIGGGTLLRSNNDGQLSSMSLANLVDPAAAQGRQEMIRYDSPTIGGFIVSASIGESANEPTWGAMLRYAGEFSGVRIAAGIGYETSRDKATGTFFDQDSASAGAYDGIEPDTKAWGASLALMHVPSGLFVQGQYIAADFGAVTSDGYWGASSIGSGTNCNVGNAGAPVPYTPGDAFASACAGSGNKKDSSQWQIQGGITKNWTGLGNTALYAEYGESKGWGARDGGRDYGSEGMNGTPFLPSVGNTNFVGFKNVTDTKVEMFGIGLVQNIDAAATELYIGWRHFDAKVTGEEWSCSGGVSGSGAAVPAGGGGAGGTQCGNAVESTPDLQAVDIIAAGARIKF